MGILNLLIALEEAGMVHICTDGENVCLMFPTGMQASEQLVEEVQRLKPDLLSMLVKCPKKMLEQIKQQNEDL